MMRIVIIILLVCLSFELSAQRSPLVISKEKVELVVTEKTTENQLKKIQKRLKDEANIDFSYKDIVFNSKKQISRITIEVDSNDGVKEAGILMVSAIYDVGFVRNYLSDGNSSEAPLIIGNIREKEIKLN